MKRRRFLKKIGFAAAGAPFWMGLMEEELIARIPSDIRITDVKNWAVGIEANQVFMKIYTNKGVTGLGEASVHRKTGACKAACDDLKLVLMGHNPTRIEFLWQGMYRWPRWRGGPVLNSAISAAEIALWDILGKLLDAPIYQLLGGAARDKIRLYVAGTGKEAVRQAKERGYTAIKTSPPTGAVKGVIKRPWNVKYAAKVFEEMRIEAGDDFDIATDAHGNLNAVMSLEYARAIEPYRPLWLEEPIQPEFNDSLEWLGRQTTVPLATGERHFTKWDFEDMISRQLVSYVQPDVIQAGGISETKKICAMAEAQFIDAALHNPSSLPCTLASLHVDACTTNCVIQESKYKFVERPSGWEEDLFKGARIRMKDGYAMLPEAPGLGCEFDESIAEKHPFEQVNPQPTFGDGSVRDY
ncbi:enolase C-terminal domain-like protein [Candidatus Latescibacterota bacterium]